MDKKKSAHLNDERSAVQGYSVGWSIKDFAAFAAHFDDVIPDFARGEVKAAVVRGEGVRACSLPEQLTEFSQVDPLGLCAAAITQGAGFMAGIWLTIASPGFAGRQVCCSLAAFTLGEDMDFEGHRLAP